MSSIIHLLPEPLINQIAAGEVVERPASVVKELLENAVDAGASEISLEVLQSGQGSIRVSDNGTGMNREDLLLSVERHATSKIQGYHDLLALKTMGFRGEALPSMAAVSRLAITSVAQGAVSGFRLEIQGGKRVGLEEVGGAPGTLVEVRDLFFNTPARLAFMKSPRIEWSQIQMAFERVALAFPNLRLELRRNDKKIFQLFPAADLGSRIKEIWGAERTEGLIPVDAEEGRFRVLGFMSPPHQHYPSPRNMAFIVNHRWVRSPLLYSLTLRAYRGTLPQGRYPMALLWLEVLPELIDVNIHPSKQEVRFSQVDWVQKWIEKALRQALSTQVPPSLPSERTGSSDEWPAASYPRTLVRESAPLFSVGSDPLPLEESWGPGQTQWSVSSEEGREGFERETTEEGSSEFKRAGAFSDLTLLAQIRQVYILAQGEKGLFLIDQHAAHERVLYEKYLQQWHKGGVSSQYLLVPILLDLPPGGLDEPEKIEKVLGPLGFEVGAAGGSSLWIKAIPADLGPEESESVLRELLEKLKGGEDLQDKDTLFRSLLKLMACHGAIRAGRSLSRDEIMILLRQLDQTEQPSHCPHGRPLWFILSWEEIEKRFKRR